MRKALSGFWPKAYLKPIKRWDISAWRWSACRAAISCCSPASVTYSNSITPPPKKSRTTNVQYWIRCLSLKASFRPPLRRGGVNPIGLLLFHLLQDRAALVFFIITWRDQRQQRGSRGNDSAKRDGCGTAGNQRPWFHAGIRIFIGAANIQR